MECNHRTNFVTDFLTSLSQKGVTAGLYHRTEYGVVLYKKLTGIELGEGTKKRNDFDTMVKNNIFFIDGKTSPKVREKIRQYIDTVPGAILLAQSKVLSTGINIKRLKNIVMLQNNKSFTDVVQILGRVMRLHPSKSHVYIFDLVDVFPYKRPSYSYQHFEFRAMYYKYERHNYIEKRFDLRKF
jgi:superfamily II DNA or RNA helicase